MVGHKLGLCLLVRKWRLFSRGLGPAKGDPVRLPPTAARGFEVAPGVGRVEKHGAARSVVAARRSEVRRLSVRWFALLLLGVGVGGGVAAKAAWAQPENEARQLPALRPAPPPLTGELEAVWLVPDVGTATSIELQAVKPGEQLSSGSVRSAMRELLDSGKYAGVRSEVQTTAPGKLRLLLFASERRVISRIEINGGDLDAAQVRAALGLRSGKELTRAGLDEAAAKAHLLYIERGYPQATVSGVFNDTGEPLLAVVTITVAPGPPALVAAASTEVTQPALPEAVTLAESFGVAVGQRLDHVELDAKKRALEDRYRKAGFLTASVAYDISASGAVRAAVRPGPQVSVGYEGLRAFDEATLRAGVELDDEVFSIAALKLRLLTFYERHGYFDARVRHVVVRSADGLRERWVFTLQEGAPLRVTARVFPCLQGALSSVDLNNEIDGVLGEQLPGQDTVFAPVDPGVIDSALEGSPNPNRVQVHNSEPWTVYSPAEYDKALTHLRDLYRAEGYLSATAGPATLLRRQCAPGTRGDSCRPLGRRVVPEAQCPTAAQPLPEEEEPQANATCRTDPAQGVFCEPNTTLSVPIKLGPRTTLWDVEFQGNRLLVDKELFDAAELPLGQPVSQIELQRARRRIGDLYGDRGFAFAEVNVELDLSQDRTRGKARFVISEREPVTIRGFVIRGAEQTRESVILGRLALRKGQLYRRDLVRTSEEQLGTLGVFSSVTVELEDPDVPAREKVVVISVEERPSQYIDIKPGFSSGEGARLALEFGHRNLLGRALQLRFRFQLGYLPNPLILDKDVREKYEALTLGERLERRNSVTLEVPFAQRFRLAVEGVDVRDNTRDFGLTKRAAIVSMSHRPGRTLSWVTGTSLENNDVSFFNTKDNLIDYLRENPQYIRLLNVPQGRSYAIALRLGGVWDRTDNPFGATRGTFVSLDSEPVVAFLDSDATVASDVACANGEIVQNCRYVSRFIKLTSRVAGYVTLNDSGLSLAVSLRVGANLQLAERSITYADRLFFLGGSDSLRGHLQDSVIPQDLAPGLSRQPGDGGLAASDVVTRGGDMVINPRIELRIPITKLFQTALFLDTGNVWRDIHNVQPWRLRYSAGTGLRVATPIGPLAFDYGFRLDRRFYESDIGAFHFSVGLF